MKILISILSLILITTSIYGQTFSIKGTIVNLENDPIELVTIYIYNIEDSNVVSMELTDNKGCFSLLVNKAAYRIKGVFFGNVLFDKELIVDKDIHLGNIKVATSIELKEIIVQSEIKPFKTIQDKVIFDINKLSGIEGYNAVNILKYAPKVIENNGTIYIGNKVATILIDNRQLSQDEINSYLNTLDAKDISRIEIQSSHGGTRDASILGGVINIVTKTKQIGLKGAVQLYSSTPRDNYYKLRPITNLFYGTKNWNIYAVYSFDKGRDQQYSETSTNYYNEEVLHTVKSKYYFNQQDHFYKIGSLVNLNKDHTLGFEFNGTNNRPSDNNSAGDISYKDKLHIDRAADLTQDSYKNDFYNTAISYLWQIDTLKSTLNVLVNYNNKSSNSKSSIQTIYNKLTDKNVSEVNITDANSKNYSAKVDFLKNWNSGYSFKVGTQYSISERNSTLSTNKIHSQKWKYREGIIGAYLGISKNITPNIFASFSLRLENMNIKGTNDLPEDKVKDNYTDIFPYIYFSQKITNNFSYNLLYTKTIYRPPFSLLNNYSNRVSDILYDVGNPDLRPEKAHIGEISFLYKKHSLTLAYQYTPKAITEQFTVKDGLIFHTNVNSGSISDLSIAYNYNGKIFQWWNTNTYASLGNNRVPKSYNRKKITYGVFSFVNTFTIPRIGYLNLNFSYNRSIIKGNNYYKGNYGCNLSYKRSFMNSHLTIQCGIDDVFNTRKHHSSVYVPNMDYRIYMKNLTRNYWISLTYRFSTNKDVDTREILNQNSIKNRL